MVSIAGPYRKGKSYILSQAFDQPDVFPLGHKMEAETMGIWIWRNPVGRYGSRPGWVVLPFSEARNFSLTVPPSIQKFKWPGTGELPGKPDEMRRGYHCYACIR